MFNWVKTAMLMAAIMALFGIVGGMLGGRQGMLLALLFGGAIQMAGTVKARKSARHATSGAIRALLDHGLLRRR